MSYNWGTWRWLKDQLTRWGVDTSELVMFNDGDPISAKTCQAIADAIEWHFDELTPDQQELLADDIDIWRHANGCAQW